MQALVRLVSGLQGLSTRLKNVAGFDEISLGSSHNRGRIEKSRGRDEKKMGDGLPLGQLSQLGTRIGLHQVSQHPGSGQNFVCPKNLVELPATFCRLVLVHDSTATEHQ